MGLFCLGTGGQDGFPAPVRDRTLDCHAAVFVDAGGGSLETGETRYDVGPGTLFWLHPGVPHSYGPGGTGWSERWVLFNGLDTARYADLGLLPTDEPVVEMSATDPVLRVFAQLRDAANTGSPQGDSVAAALVHQLIATVHRLGEQRPATRAAAVLTALRDAALHRDIGQHAVALNISVVELRAIVRRATGGTPKEIIVQTRLSQAKSLLAQTDLPVARVATRVGYADPAYFTRLFTKHVGEAPSVFRDHYLRGGTGRS
ncbi:MAG: helix-turn-helix domain-containing protein [Propionibacteriales bacterium]|nr:helix-turn-helix domain-containing protein [Propionibacteriales bacterium]